jgi:hypothetical protein
MVDELDRLTKGKKVRYGMTGLAEKDTMNSARQAQNDLAHIIRETQHCGKC